MTNKFNGLSEPTKLAILDATLGIQGTMSEKIKREIRDWASPTLVVYIDIDNTICRYDNDVEAPDYNLAIPIHDNIKKANRLYDIGHVIVYSTARGATTGIDWSDLTRSQLKEWNAKYTRLDQKPYYDVIIDDKAINTLDWL